MLQYKRMRNGQRDWVSVRVLLSHALSQVVQCLSWLTVLVAFTLAFLPTIFVLCVLIVKTRWHNIWLRLASLTRWTSQRIQLLCLLFQSVHPSGVCALKRWGRSLSSGCGRLTRSIGASISLASRFTIAMMSSLMYALGCGAILIYFQALLYSRDRSIRMHKHPTNK